MNVLPREKQIEVIAALREGVGIRTAAGLTGVNRDTVVTGDPNMQVSTSYVERQNLSLRMSSRRFTRLTNGFSKKLDNHIAAVALYICHCNLCRIYEALRTRPAKAIGVADRAWTNRPRLRMLRSL